MKRQSFLGKFLGRSGAGEERDRYDELNLEEKDMIRGVVELSEKSVKEVIVPRIDVVFVSVNAPTDDLLETVIDQVELEVVLGVDGHRPGRDGNGRRRMGSARLR